LHIGKAGGGHAEEIFSLWNTTIPKGRSCHPNPCVEKIEQSSLIFVTIRDPVDRFVSAFNWRSILACKEEDIRKKKNNYQATKKPNVWCKDVKERDILQKKYNNHPDELAVAICGRHPTTNDNNDDDNNDNNDNNNIDGITANNDDMLMSTTTAEQDLLAINHVKWTLSQWLPQRIIKRFLVDDTMGGGKNNESNSSSSSSIRLLPFVNEPGYNFTRQIGNQIRYAIKEQYNEFEANYQSNVYKQNVIKKFPNGYSVSKTAKHSSKQVGGVDNAKLSLLRECCMTRYHYKDYDLIQKISEHFCYNNRDDDNGTKGGECKQALESIYNRRALYLKNISINPFDYCSSIL